MPAPANGFTGCCCAPGGVADLVYVWVATTSMFSGYGEMRSIYERDASMVVALNRWRALNSYTSVVNSRVTSITGMLLSSPPNAATGKVIRMAWLLAAFTACEIGVLGSATTL